MISMVTYSMIGLCRQLSVSSIQKVLQLLTGQKIFALLFLGCLAVTPMIVYDKVYADKLSVPSRGGFFNMTSWSLNVVNNVAGAGGMVGASLRYALLGQHVNARTATKMSFHISLFSLSGLSINYSISALLIKNNNVSILAGSLSYISFLIIVYPLIPLMLKTPSLKFPTKLILLMTSVIEWFACFGIVLLSNAILNLNIDLFVLYQSYFFSAALGVASLIPGSAGSFDLSLTETLKHAGVLPNTSASLLILYRLFYYVIPTILAVVWFILLKTNILQSKANKW